MTTRSYDEELAFALALCEEADAISTASFERGPTISIKPDGTPVTDADAGIERLIRERLAERFPSDGVLGEEFGEEGQGARRWVIDPIDGTKNFAGGIPLWSTLIALQVEGHSVVGVVSIPGVGQRYWATAGGGAFRNGSPLKVSDVATTTDAMVLFGDIEAVLGTPIEIPFLDVIRGARRTRGFGDAWGYGIVAAGNAEAMIEAELMLWDVAAPAAIVEEAGGRITQLDGSPLKHGGSALATNGVLHDAYMEALRPEGQGR